MSTHNITLRGDVQDVGLRELIADLGRTQDRRGFVFNEVDGTVRVVTEGPSSQVEGFIKQIKQRSTDLRGHIESIEIEEIDGELSLPSFMIPPTDDLDDISRKLGKGVRRLSNIEENTDRLSRIEEDTARLSRIEENTERLPSIEEDTARLSRIEENTERLPNIEENTHKLVDGQERMIDILDERL